MGGQPSTLALNRPLGKYFVERITGHGRLRGHLRYIKHHSKQNILKYICKISLTPSMPLQVTCDTSGPTRWRCPGPTKCHKLLSCSGWRPVRIWRILSRTVRVICKVISHDLWRTRPQIYSSLIGVAEMVLRSGRLCYGHEFSCFLFEALCGMFEYMNISTRSLRGIKGLGENTFQIWC